MRQHDTPLLERAVGHGLSRPVPPMAKDTTVCAGRLFLLVDCAVACTGQILVPVSEDRKVAVRSEMVSLLEGPGLPHPIAAQVPLGTILKVQGRNREEDWIRVLHEGQALWIFADYIDLTPDKLDALPVVPGRGPSMDGRAGTTPQKPISALLTVTGNTVNVRTKPGTGLSYQ